MKKGAVLLILFLALTIPLIAADESTQVTKAYSCLEGKVKDKCSQLTLEEQTFSLLALSYNSAIQSECISSIRDKSSNNTCWPSSGCKIKDTSQVTLALQGVNADSSNSEAWLLRQNKTPTDLLWFLEIDAKEASTCKIYLDNSSAVSSTVTQGADKKLSISGTSCLTLANQNYWLQISPSCINRVFKVSCDKDFSSALLYKKSSGTSADVWHVSSQTQAASSGGTTENQPVAYCFKQNDNCDYEGSLWAALALQKENDISNYLPYLIAFAPDNEKFNPHAFLYILTGSDEELALINDAQNPSGFFDLSSPYGKFYDTALSLRALKDVGTDTIKTWLLSVQADTGCWQNSIRDTSFILYSGWPKTPVSVSSGSTIDYCEDAGDYCSSRTECTDAGGEVLDNFFCRSDSLKSCCSKQIIQQSCSEKSGIICQAGEDCSGNLVSSSDSSRCCVEGACQVQEVSTCEQSGFLCKSICSSTEELKSGVECSAGSVCCGEKTQTKSYLWLWILIILIILVVLGIIFRKRLQVVIYKFRNRKPKSSSVTQTRPPFPPAGTRTMPRPVFSRPPAQPVQRAKSKVDDELEQTLKKLKDMSK